MTAQRRSFQAPWSRGLLAVQCVLNRANVVSFILRFWRIYLMQAAVEGMNSLFDIVFPGFLLLKDEFHSFLDDVTSCVWVLKASLQHFDHELDLQALSELEPSMAFSRFCNLQDELFWLSVDCCHDSVLMSCKASWYARSHKQCLLFCFPYFFYLFRDQIVIPVNVVT